MEAFWEAGATNIWIGLKALPGTLEGTKALFAVGVCLKKSRNFVDV
jgi:hypothetical protein